MYIPLRELSDSYLMNTNMTWFQRVFKYLCALEESSLSIERVNGSKRYVSKDWPEIPQVNPWCCWWLIWPNTKWCNIPNRMTETLTHRYSSKSTEWELSSKYQHDRVKMVLKKICVLMLSKEVASVIEGIKDISNSLNSLKNLCRPSVCKDLLEFHQ